MIELEWKGTVYTYSYLPQKSLLPSHPHTLLP